ncbi:hypothetical protein KSP40_PGU007467 [Platanthera guangdongensis]|uniref:Uncharacterized protein n=1 Tax=Platanthera guangdongensis TaxID=2320717 RepID=A0ABR2MIJ7_9ASPA
MRLLKAARLEESLSYLLGYSFSAGSQTRRAVGQTGPAPHTMPPAIGSKRIPTAAPSARQHPPTSSTPDTTFPGQTLENFCGRDPDVEVGTGVNNLLVGPTVFSVFLFPEAKVAETSIDLHLPSLPFTSIDRKISRRQASVAASGINGAGGVSLSPEIIASAEIRGGERRARRTRLIIATLSPKDWLHNHMLARIHRQRHVLSPDVSNRTLFPSPALTLSLGAIANDMHFRSELDTILEPLDVPKQGLDGDEEDAIPRTGELQEEINQDTTIIVESKNLEEKQQLY